MFFLLYYYIDLFFDFGSTHRQAQKLIFLVLVQKSIKPTIHAISTYTVLCDDDDWCI
jgi:hypothetical protein